MAFSHWYPASFRRAFVESFADQNKFFWTLTRNTVLAFLVLSVPLCFAQHDSSSSPSSSSSSGGGGGHSSGGGSAPSFSAPAASSHSVPTSFSTSVSSSSSNTHSPTGHVGGNPPHPYPGPGSGPTPHLKWSGGGGTVDVYPEPYPVYIPYAVDDNSTTADASDADNADDTNDCQGGPTVFDGCGTGAASYIPPVDPGPVHTQPHDTDAVASLSAPEPASDPTLLVFKDGHQLEVQNYAVLGQTLYDLTPGHRRKIAMAELDLPATEKANDDRGISFEFPASPQTN